MKIKFKWPRLLPAVAAATALCLAPQAADAQWVTFAGTTDGCFGACTLDGGGDTFQGLTFTPGTFNVDDYAWDSFVTGVNNFGVWTLTGPVSGNQSYSETFKLGIMFTSPTANNVLFSALVTGTVRFESGGITIAYDSPTQWTWSEGGYTYLVGIHNEGLNLTTGQNTASTNQTGYVKATVPEPMSMLLVGSGLLALAGVARRRRNDGDMENI